jgi:MFS family permease
VFGLGAGAAFPALVTLAMSDVAPQDAGVASGLVNTTAQVGGALGLAVLATAAASRTDSLTAAGRSAAEALNGGYHLAFYIGAGLLGVALLVATFVLHPTPAPAHTPSGEPATAEA